MGETKRRRLAPVTKTPLGDDIKTDIASTVTMFRFTEDEGGNCVPRAMIAHAVLLACGLPSRVVPGSMIFRAGPHPIRDTLRFSLPNNKGGFFQGALVGHVWNEYGSDLIDFSVGYWQAEAELNRQSRQHCQDLPNPTPWWQRKPIVTSMGLIDSGQWGQVFSTGLDQGNRHAISEEVCPGERWFPDYHHAQADGRRGGRGP